MVKSQKGLSGVERGKGICYQWKEKGQCSKGDQCSFRHESNDRAKPTPKNVFAVGALVTSELIAEQRLTLTEDLRNLHPKENVLEIAKMKSKKHRNMCHGDTVEDDVVVDESSEKATGIMPPLPPAP